MFDKKNRILLKELVKTDFKLRYQGSVIGYIWSVLKPLMLFAVMYVVFIYFLNKSPFETTDIKPRFVVSVKKLHKTMPNSNATAKCGTSAPKRRK